MTIDAAGRYPQTQEIVAKAETGGTVLRLSATDAAFLADALPRLPTTEFSECGVTLDLSRPACIRARGAEDNPLTELVLSGSTVCGEPLRLATDRQYLLHALKLGLKEVRFSDPAGALLATDSGRKYIWMPLAPKDAIGPCENAIRIDSAGGPTAMPASPSKPKPRRRSAMSNSSTTAAAAQSPALPNENTVTSAESLAPEPTTPDTVAAATSSAANDGQTAPTPQVQRTRVRRANRQLTVGPIEQAVALRNALRESLTKTNELIRSLKRQRRQSKLVATTLASLKQLQQAG